MLPLESGDKGGRARLSGAEAEFGGWRKGWKTRLLIPQVCKRHARVTPSPSQHTETPSHPHTLNTQGHTHPHTHTQAAQATAPRVLTEEGSRARE